MVLSYAAASSSSSPRSNQQLAQERLAANQAAKEAVKQSIDRTNRRNYELKQRLMHSSTAANANNNSNNNTTTIRDLYQVKVTVCEQLRQELKLSGREKRGRVFLERNATALSSLKALRGELHGFFRALRKDTYVLRAGYPVISENNDGKVTAVASATTNDNDNNYWSIESDEDVVKTFQKADAFFEAALSSSQPLQRPAIVVHVAKDPNAPPPPPPPAYLKDMPDPNDSTHMTMLSFYAFPPAPPGIANPHQYAEQLRQLWKPFRAVGRVYVAQEGVNAQMSVPTNVLEAFRECCHALPEQVGSYIRENGGLNVDPVPLTREEFAVAGATAASGQPAPPFTNLHIRVRQQVVADGLLDDERRAILRLAKGRLRHAAFGVARQTQGGKGAAGTTATTTTTEWSRIYHPRHRHPAWWSWIVATATRRMSGALRRRNRWKRNPFATRGRC